MQRHKTSVVAVNMLAYFFVQIFSHSLLFHHKSASRQTDNFTIDKFTMAFIGDWGLGLILQQQHWNCNVITATCIGQHSSTILAHLQHIFIKGVVRWTFQCWGKHVLACTSLVTSHSHSEILLSVLIPSVTTSDRRHFILHYPIGSALQQTPPFSTPHSTHWPFGGPLCDVYNPMNAQSHVGLLKPWLYVGLE